MSNNLAEQWANYKPLTWCAIYKDESTLSEYNPDGTKNRYEDIKREELVRFDMINEKGRAIYSLYLRYGQRLIYRRRTLIRVTSEGEKRQLIYLVGWQMTVYTNKGPQNITAINYIFEDGSISLDDSRSNLELLELEEY